jgi:glycosyltransferase involved in cell wall biosynthesis
MEGAEADISRAGAWLCGLCADEGPDVVHLNGYALASLPLGAPILVAAHSCVLSWHEAVRGRRAGPEWTWYARVAAAGLRAADAVVAPTEAMLAQVERLYRIVGERAVIPNGRSATVFRPLPKERYVVGAGRVWDEAKNLAALQRVAPRLEWPVRIAGGDIAPAELAQLLRRAAVFAAPARYEPFGLAALEAGLAGCALVLGDIASLHEVWGGAALYVDPNDDEALAAALGRAMHAAEALGPAARGRALSYPPERMAAAYLEVYERLVTERLDADVRARAGVS